LSHDYFRYVFLHFRSHLVVVAGQLHSHPTVSFGKSFLLACSQYSVEQIPYISAVRVVFFRQIHSFLAQWLHNFSEIVALYRIASQNEVAPCTCLTSLLGARIPSEIRRKSKQWLYLPGSDMPKGGPRGRTGAGNVFFRTVLIFEKACECLNKTAQDCFRSRRQGQCPAPVPIVCPKANSSGEIHALIFSTELQ
jgi:hypothetical protein